VARIRCLASTRAFRLIVPTTPKPPFDIWPQSLP